MRTFEVADVISDPPGSDTNSVAKNPRRHQPTKLATLGSGLDNVVRDLYREEQSSSPPSAAGETAMAAQSDEWTDTDRDGGVAFASGQSSESFSVSHFPTATSRLANSDAQG